jgi:hypothetical protein
MTTINLEKTLIRENQKLATPKELLLIGEYDKFTQLAENDALSRIGLNRAIKEGGLTKNRIGQKIQETTKYSKERVFHISQIKAICEKYYLRFLRAEYYKGIIDNELPDRITNFEAAYNIKCTSRNTMIVAPIESFELQKKPKDPLLFYQINDEYFYLIHKWGNDLNILRRLKAIYSNVFISLLTACILFPLPLLLIPKAELIVYIIVGGVILVFFGIWDLMSIDDEGMRFYTKNEWDSSYI